MPLLSGRQPDLGDFWDTVSLKRHPDICLYGVNTAFHCVSTCCDVTACIALVWDIHFSAWRSCHMCAALLMRVATVNGMCDMYSWCGVSRSGPMSYFAPSS